MQNRISLKLVKSAFTFRPPPTPASGGHFVVVVRFHKGQLTVIDPAKGVKSIAPVDFRRNWQGYVLLLEPPSLSRGEESTQDVMEPAGQ